MENELRNTFAVFSYIPRLLMYMGFTSFLPYNPLFAQFISFWGGAQTRPTTRLTVFAAIFARHTVGQNCQKCKET